MKLLGKKFELEKETLKNNNYRKVVSTTPHQQLVLMSLKPRVEIGGEVHPDTTQFFRIEDGECSVQIGKRGSVQVLKSGDSITVPPNKWHNVWNNGKKDVKLYTIYSPPEHPPNRVQKEKP